MLEKQTEKNMDDYMEAEITSWSIGIIYQLRGCKHTHAHTFSRGKQRILAAAPALKARPSFPVRLLADVALIT